MEDVLLFLYTKVRQLDVVFWLKSSAIVKSAEKNFKNYSDIYAGKGEIPVQKRAQGMSLLKIFFSFLLILSWYSDPSGFPTPLGPLPLGASVRLVGKVFR